MFDELSTLANDLKDFLVKQHHITNVQGPDPLRPDAVKTTPSRGIGDEGSVEVDANAEPDWRHWELRFTHRGIPRHYVYHIQRVDPLSTMFQALRADSNGELMVRIPEDQAATRIDTNTLYYPPHG